MVVLVWVVWMCCCCFVVLSCCLFFFFNDTATTEIYTLSLHDALRSPMLARRPPPSNLNGSFDVSSDFNASIRALPEDKYSSPLKNLQHDQVEDNLCQLEETDDDDDDVITPIVENKPITQARITQVWESQHKDSKLKSSLIKFIKSVFRCLSFFQFRQCKAKNSVWALKFC